MKTYTITTISQMFDIPASTLRYYESVGLLSNVDRHHTSVFTQTVTYSVFMPSNVSKIPVLAYPRCWISSHMKKN